MKVEIGEVWEMNQVTMHFNKHNARSSCGSIMTAKCWVLLAPSS